MKREKNSKHLVNRSKLKNMSKLTGHKVGQLANFNEMTLFSFCSKGYNLFVNIVIVSTS